MRNRLRQSNLWLLLRKAQREGFGNAFRRWRLWRRILETAPVYTETEGFTEVRLMCYFFDYLCAIWSLKTFYRASGVSLPLTIQLQGRAPAHVARTLQQHFPAAQILQQAEADRVVEQQLSAHGWGRLLAARRANHYMQKLTDTVLLSRFSRVIYLDSDLLFFRKPTELLTYSGDHLFQQDPESTYLVEQAKGVHIAPRLNVGLMNFVPNKISLARCNEYLADFPHYRGWIEQTLFALHAAETGTAEVLPPTYLISPQTGIDPSTLVMRHYAGPTRPLLTSEGMPWLINHGFLER